MNNLPPYMRGFEKISDREGAVFATGYCSQQLYFFAAVQGFFSLYGAYHGLLDALVLAICAFFIERQYSRVAAVIALLECALIGVLAIRGLFGGSVGWVTLCIGAFGPFVAIRAVEATFKVKRFSNETRTIPRMGEEK